MKYCKSKRGYFYKVVGDKNTRISMEEYKAGCKKLAMKGGFTEDGNVEPNDFDIYANFNSNQSKYQNELPDSRKISILYNRNGIPHVFFGQNEKTSKYKYVMFYNSANNKIIIKILDNDQVLNITKDRRFIFINNNDYIISAPILLNLCHKFLVEYERNKTDKMKIIYDYLKDKFIKLMDKYPTLFLNKSGQSTPYSNISNEVMRKFKSNTE